MAIPEIYHQLTSLRAQALGALPSPPRTDAISPESYPKITAKIRSADLRNPDETRSILDCVIKNDNAIALSILMLNPDFDMDYLIEQLPEVAAQGKINIVRTMLLKISENPALTTPTDLLGTMLIKAAEAGQLEVVQALVRTEAYGSIPINYLSLAVSQAREHPDVIEAFRTNDRFHEVRVISDREALASIFREASREGQFGVVRAIMESSRFREISAEDLGNALIDAARGGQSEVVQTLIESGRFHQISPGHLGFALGEAARVRQLDVVRAIMESGRFHEIPPNLLGWALGNAAGERQLEIVQAIMESGRFREISAEDLGLTLIYAVESGHLQTVQAIMECGRFHETSTEHLFAAYRLAFGIAVVPIENSRFRTHSINFRENKFEIARVFVNCDRFQEINGLMMEFVLIKALKAGEFRIARDIIHNTVGTTLPTILACSVGVGSIAAALLYRYLATQNENQ